MAALQGAAKLAGLTISSYARMVMRRDLFGKVLT